jgi:hypothetical protein
MYKITNIESLGTDYTVADSNGKVIDTIQVIPHTEILEAALGEYTSDIFDNISSYLEKSISVLEGNEAINPHRVLWYSTTKDEIVLAEVIEYAIKHGYDKIILEHLGETE